MIERDRYAFAALSCIMQSEGDSEIVVDTAKREGVDSSVMFAEAAFKIGDAMYAHSLKLDALEL